MPHHNLTDIRNFNTPPLSALVKNNCRDESHKLIAALIILLNNFLGTSWGDSQLEEVSKEFYSRYFYWTQLDLKNFIRRCKANDFKEKILSVNQFSPIIFMTWADEYNEQWLTLSQDIYLLEHDKKTYDPKRETEIYNEDLRIKEGKKDARETIINMSQAIQRQQAYIENIKGNNEQN